MNLKKRKKEKNEKERKEYVGMDARVCKFVLCKILRRTNSCKKYYERTVKHFNEEYTYIIKYNTHHIRLRI